MIFSSLIVNYAPLITLTSIKPPITSKSRRYFAHTEFCQTAIMRGFPYKLYIKACLQILLFICKSFIRTVTKSSRTNCLIHHRRITMKNRLFVFWKSWSSFFTTIFHSKGCSGSDLTRHCAGEETFYSFIDDGKSTFSFDLEIYKKEIDSVCNKRYSRVCVL